MQFCCLFTVIKDSGEISVGLIYTSGMTSKKIRVSGLTSPQIGLSLFFPFVVCSFTLLGFLGSFFWVFDLCAHFRVQYLAILVLSSIFFLILKRFRAAAGFAVFALINLIAIAPLFFGEEESRILAPERLRLLVLNVNSTGGDVDKVMQLIRKSDADLVALQEISSRWLKQLAQQKSAYSFSIISPREDNFGMALLSRIPLLASESVTIGKTGVPSIVSRVLWKLRPVQIIVTHPLPPIGPGYADRRDDQLEQLSGFIDSEVPTIITGDLNTTPWGYAFKRLLRQSGLKNSARGFGIQATWPAGNIFLRIPIDHVLLSSDFRVIERSVGESVDSDHLPILIELASIYPVDEVPAE